MVFEQWDVREIIEHTSDGFFSVDENWNFTYMNKVASTLLQRECKDLIGRSLWEEFPEAVHNSFFTHYHQAFREKKAVEFEEYYPAPLDAWYNVRAIPSHQGLMVFFRNITTKKKAALEREQHYKSLFHQNPDAVFSFDLHGKFLSVNPSTVELTGYSVEELLDMSYTPFMHPLTSQQTQRHFELAAQGIPQVYESLLIHKSGAIITCHVTNFPIIVDGEIVGVYGLAKNLTQLKNAEYGNLSNKSRLKSLLLFNPEAIYTLDIDRRIVDSNPAGVNLLGHSRKELLRMKIDDILRIDRTYDVSLLVEEALQGRAVDPWEIQVTCKDETLLIIECQIVPIIVNETVLGSYWIMKDMTKQKQTERLLLEAEKLNIAGQLAAAVAHEIRNPLTAIKGFIKLLQGYNPDERGYIFDILQEEMDRIESITRELMLLAKPQAAAFRSVDLVGTLQSVITLINVQAIMQNVQIHLDYNDLPKVRGVENQLKQVFINLLKNAIESMPHGGNIHLRLLTPSNPGDDMHILISDEGCGIPEERIARMGEPFYSTKEKGTGLGFMVSRKIVESHQGTMTVTSRVGVGTTIDIELPLEPNDP
ncbi:PAS domain S-box protein [Paenibacillus turpanensis]|uniref:PAS domain S-box protein n=1 Tax=Paenibacillus turpanensis TaxID=2689078 RepID=UPI00140E8F3C|nr:PAS domain S-box protein [Paenibacillus turpanensis]